MNIDYLSQKIGIIGGGQLGKMMILEAKKLGFYVITLDPSPGCPSHSISDEHIVAAFNDKKAIRSLAEKTDVITYEFEHIDCDILLELENEGYKIYPTAKSLKIIQNKYTQKLRLAQNNIPTADFMKIDSIDDMYTAAKELGCPFMLKTCLGGYDGKGNAFVHDIDCIKQNYDFFGGGKNPLMAERLVPFIMETSVLVCRGVKGDIAVYSVGDNRHLDNILHETIVPANIPKNVEKLAMELAYKVMQVFEGVGMFCIEMFITANGEVIINEIAPRPHNSGHYSIEGCVTSQFQNHIRAVTGLPLGSTRLVSSTVMINLLGEKGFSGKAAVVGLYDALKIDGVTVHIYGKQETHPKRKMGHLCACAETAAEAAQNAHRAFKKIKIISN